MRLDFGDKKSGMDSCTAAKQLIDEARAAGGAGNDLNIKPIPYWENLFPDAAGDPNGYGGNYSATANMADWFMQNEPDWMTALWVADEFCFPACANTGGGPVFQPADDPPAGHGPRWPTPDNTPPPSVPQTPSPRPHPPTY